MREWTHRRLLIGHLGNIGVMVAGLALLGAVVERFTSRELAVYVGSLATVIGCFGIAQGYGHFCANAAMAPKSRPGIELRLLPLLVAAAPAWWLVEAAREYPDVRFATLALAAAATAVFWAVLSGCRAIWRAGRAR